MVDEVEATLAACVDHLAREDRFLLAALRERAPRDVIALHATLSPQELGGLLDVLTLASNPAELAHLVTELKGLRRPAVRRDALPLGKAAAWTRPRRCGGAAV